MRYYVGMKKAKVLATAPENHFLEEEVAKIAKMGRPSDFTQELGDDICARLAQGESLRSVCRSETMPSLASIFNWFRSHPDFLEQYTRAKEASAEAMYEDLAELGDDAIQYAQTLKGPQSSAVVQAVKLKADNLKWSMSKMKPKKYGEKVDLTSAGEAIKGNTIVFKDFKGDETSGQSGI